MSDKIILCECNGEGIRIQDCGDGEMLLSIYVTKSTQALTFWQRVKFMFNRWAVYGEVLLSTESVAELIDALTDFVDGYDNER